MCFHCNFLHFWSRQRQVWSFGGWISIGRPEISFPPFLERLLTRKFVFKAYASLPSFGFPIFSINRQMALCLKYDQKSTVNCQLAGKKKQCFIVKSVWKISAMQTLKKRKMTAKQLIADCFVLHWNHQFRSRFYELIVQFKKKTP